MSGTESAADPTTLKGEKERLGYSIGMDVGSVIKRQAIEVDPDTVARGFKDVYTGGKT